MAQWFEQSSGTNQILTSVHFTDALNGYAITGVNGTAGAGTAQFDAADLSSGVYFYRLRAGSFVATRKLIYSAMNKIRACCKGMVMAFRKIIHSSFSSATFLQRHGGKVVFMKNLCAA